MEPFVFLMFINEENVRVSEEIAGIINRVTFIKSLDTRSIYESPCVSMC